MNIEREQEAIELLCECHIVRIALSVRLMPDKSDADALFYRTEPAGLQHYKLFGIPLHFRGLIPITATSVNVLVRRWELAFDVDLVHSQSPSFGGSGKGIQCVTALVR